MLQRQIRKLFLLRFILSDDSSTIFYSTSNGYNNYIAWKRHLFFSKRQAKSILTPEKITDLIKTLVNKDVSGE